MQFSLKNTKGTSSSQPRLKGNEIHTVAFKGVTYNTFQGKDDKTKTYQVMKIRFENSDGYYEESVFAPREGDDKRQVIKVGDKTKESPSNMEKLHFLLAHIGEQLAPSKYAKFRDLTFDLPKDFEKMVRTFAKVTEEAVGKITKLKLSQNKKGEVTLPYFVNINKDGDAYISNNFLGDKVFFSDYELKKIEESKNQKPTDMNEVVASDIDTVDSNSDLNFDVDI